jgi:hypothetical protein
MLAGAMLSAIVAMAPPGGGEVSAPRGNSILTRTRGLTYSVAAAPRFGILLGDGRRVMQPFGFGAGLQLRLHGILVPKLRIGGELQLGHTRFLERKSITQDDGSPASRYAALGHTDFALGPSLQIVAGPVLLEGGFGAGLAISHLARPLPRAAVSTNDAGDSLLNTEESFDDTTAMIRGGGHVGIPIRRNQGVIVGAAAQKFFSRRLVVADADLANPDAEANANPFDLLLEVYVGYQMWF